MFLLMDFRSSGNMSKTTLSNYEVYEEARTGSILRYVSSHLGEYNKKGKKHKCLLS